MPRAKATILCVDDHRKELVGRRLLLEKKGYKVLQAASGCEGLEMLHSQAVDAIVLEYQVSGISTHVIAEKMKNINSDVPIVLLAAREPYKKVESVDTFLSGSQPPEILLYTVEQLLDRKPFFFRWLDNWKVRNQGARR
jgi:CheY-like chemotaxis protein